MQLTRTPRGDLLPGQPIASPPWTSLREGQEDTFRDDCEVIPGIGEVFTTASVAFNRTNSSGGRNLTTWLPTFKITRPLDTGAAFDIHVYGGGFALEIVASRVTAGAQTVLGTFITERPSETAAEAVNSIVIAGAVAADTIIFRARAALGEFASLATIHDFFIREKFAEDAELP